ncbi:MAG TPA: DinB family protein [Terriglobia bacterium]|nr:DinB family protein [Terriglobia bacterium]
MTEEKNAGKTGPGAEDALALVRKQIVASFHDENVHGGFDRAFADVPPGLRGVKAGGLPYTLWGLLEHLRLCVLDFLEYCRRPGYVEPPFPAGYWPESDGPPDEAAWDWSLEGFVKLMKDFESLILDPATDLLLPLPGGSGRTVLRQALACLDHNSYHLGQAIVLRRLLGLWPEKPAGQ